MKDINKDIARSHTLPGMFYSSDRIFDQSIESIFARSWQFITDDSVLQEVGSVYPFSFMQGSLNEPLFLINNKKIECFSNVCTHRGNILINESGVVKKNIVCGYHGKQFDKCGKFLFMPKSECMKNFPTCDDDLTSVNVEKWRQFIFTSLSPSINFGNMIHDIEERVGWMPIEEFRFREDLSKEYIIDANWALYCDNYLEGFHIPFIHKDLAQTLDYDNYDIKLFDFCNLQIGVSESSIGCFELPKSSLDYGKNIAAYYYWLFPNLMLNFYPWGLSINIVFPLSKNQTKIVFRSYVWDESKLHVGAGADLNKVELEDEEIVQRVQKGVSSRFYNHGRFSPSMEQGVHHFHRLISRFMNV